MGGPDAGHKSEGEAGAAGEHTEGAGGAKEGAAAPAERAGVANH